jgi:FKBP-type peptidyl-prolyl cis-trans isomerase FkpA
MKRVKQLFPFLSLFLLIMGCNNVDFRKTAGGVPYKVFSSGKGDSIKVDQVVKFHVIQKLGDSVLFNSYKENTPQYSQVRPLTSPAPYTDIRSTIMELFPKLKKGDSVYLVQVTDSLMKIDPEAEKSGRFKKGQEIVTTIKILEIFKTTDEADVDIQKANEPKMKENMAKAEQADRENLAQFHSDTAKQAQLQRDNKLIEDYMKKHNITAQKTDWGVYVQVLQPGQGPKPTIGKYAYVKYKGTHLSGEQFDAGEFPMQIGAPGMIKGFEEGVKQMAKGGKALIIIPSVIAYGTEGRAPTIKPNENLVFDLELLDISDRPINRQPNIDTTQARK